MFMKSVFHGRLTKAIELKHSNNGHAVCRFQLACDRYVGGDKGTITEYPSFVAWRGLAERLANNTQKGSELLIEAQYTSYKKISRAKSILSLWWNLKFRALISVAVRKMAQQRRHKLRHQLLFPIKRRRPQWIIPSHLMMTLKNWKATIMTFRFDAHSSLVL